MRFFWDSHNVLGVQLHHLPFLFNLVQVKSVFQKNNICLWIILRLRWIWILFKFVLGTKFLVYINYIFVLSAFFWTWNKIFAINFDWSFFYIIFGLEPTLLFCMSNIWILKHILILQDLVKTLLIWNFWNKFCQLFSFIFAYNWLIQTKLIWNLFANLVFKIFWFLLNTL